jgi:hypothetical protein
MPRKPRTDGKPPHTLIDRPQAQHPAVTRVVKPVGVKGNASVVIDEVALYEAAMTHASFEHLGRIFGVAGSTLHNNLAYRELIYKARAEKCKELLAAQFSNAIGRNNAVMQIWLGKQYLGQKDVQRIESTGADGGPVKQETTLKAVAYFPENNRNKKLPAATTTLVEDTIPARAEGDTAELEVEEVEVTYEERKYHKPAHRAKKRLAS